MRQYNEGGYRVTSSPIGAFALRYDFVDWGSSRPFFDIGTILSPFQKVRYARSYTTSLGAVSLESSTTSENYAVYGRAGWMSRLSPRDEVAASVEVWQLWQRVKGYMDPTVAFNPFDASIATGTDRTSLVKVGGQWTHLFGSSVEANINGGWVQSFGTRSGIVASVTGDGTIVPTIGNQGCSSMAAVLASASPRLGRRPVPQRTAGPQPVAIRLHAAWAAGQLLGNMRRMRKGALRFAPCPPFSASRCDGGHASLCPPYENALRAPLRSYARFSAVDIELTQPVTSRSGSAWSETPASRARTIAG
jgi:hypothetical protein